MNRRPSQPVMRELVELVQKIHPGLTRHERRAEARRLAKQARRELRRQAVNDGA